MNIDKKDRKKIAIIAVVAIFVVMLGVYFLLPDTTPTAEQLTALSVRSEALAKEYQGESVLVQAKAQLVSAYPDTFIAAGQSAVKVGTGTFLVLLGLGALYLIFSLGTSLIVRSTADAYNHVQRANIISDLQFSNPGLSALLSGSGGDGVLDYSDIIKRTDAARTGGGGADGAVDRYTNPDSGAGSGKQPTPKRTKRK